MSPYEKYGAGIWLTASAHAIARTLKSHEQASRWVTSVAESHLGLYLEVWLAQRLGHASAGEIPKEFAASAALCEHLGVRRVLVEVARNELTGAGVPGDAVDSIFTELDSGRTNAENNRRSSRSSHASISHLPQRKRHIASLDDSRTWQTQLRTRVPERVEVHAVGDWPALVELLRKTPIDLVLLDLYMPEPDGLECLTRLRADRRFCRLPIALCTSRPTALARQRAKSLGALDLLGKVDDAGEFTQRLQEMLDAPLSIVNAG